jgi:hypothetical protein
MPTRTCVCLFDSKTCAQLIFDVQPCPEILIVPCIIWLNFNESWSLLAASHRQTAATCIADNRLPYEYSGIHLRLSPFNVGESQPRLPYRAGTSLAIQRFLGAMDASTSRSSPVRVVLLDLARVCRCTTRPRGTLRGWSIAGMAVDMQLQLKRTCVRALEKSTKGQRGSTHLQEAYHKTQYKAWF